MSWDQCNASNSLFSAAHGITTAKLMHVYPYIPTHVLLEWRAHLKRSTCNVFEILSRFFNCVCKGFLMLCWVRLGWAPWPWDCEKLSIEVGIQCEPEMCGLQWSCEVVFFTWNTSDDVEWPWRVVAAKWSEFLPHVYALVHIVTTNWFLSHLALLLQLESLHWTSFSCSQSLFLFYFHLGKSEWK